MRQAGGKLIPFYAHSVDVCRCVCLCVHVCACETFNAPPPNAGLVSEHISKICFNDVMYRTG